MLIFSKAQLEQRRLSLARHRRRLLARQRKAEGREYLSIISGDLYKFKTSEVDK